VRITHVAFRDFPPFADAIVEFPPITGANGAAEVQLLTGQNGTGKTRLLCLLAAACGNSYPLKKRLGTGETTNSAVAGEHGGYFGYCRGLFHEVRWTNSPEAVRAILDTGTAPSLSHTSDRLTNPPDGGASQPAALTFRGMARVTDVPISALAPVNLGNPVDHLTFEPVDNESLIICQSMANLKMTAAMDTLRKLPRTKSRATRILECLEGTISNITGREFSFEVTPHPEVRLRVFWGSVPMSLLQLPDGLRSIIGWLVSCIAKLEALFPNHPDPLGTPLILLLDEPEGHLHPAWQRKVLPAAQMLFPQAQIFAATHSPFVISSVNEGWVHILRADDTGMVTVEPPLECSKGDTYLDVVEDILGVKEWYDPETEALLAEFRQTRNAVFNGSGEFDTLEALAHQIADRSDSLRDLIAREMRQVERLTANVGSGS
jgi:hypothetical protein